MSDLIRFLRGATVGDGAGLSDGQLLLRYIGSRDEAAFAALTRRHGPLVWGVCCRVLGNHADAEDAFQATFLVLAKKAASIRPRQGVAPWLYGVAYRTALKARGVVARQRRREKQLREMPEPDGLRQDEILWRELQPLLDQELSRLPDLYRVPTVLCDLEGKTHKEAARLLGCPDGTLSARLSRARALLAKQLSRRGLAVTGGLLAALVIPSAASVAVPPSVVSAAIAVATRPASGQAAAGAVSARVALLAEGVLKTMLLDKLKIPAAILLVVSLAAVGGALLFYQPAAAQPSAIESPVGAKRDAGPRNKGAATDKPARPPAVSGLLATRVRFPDAAGEKIANAGLQLLAGCLHSAKADEDDWLKALRACHVHVKFPEARTVVVNGKQRVVVSQMIVTFPLHSTGGITVRSGDNYWYFAKFSSLDWGNKIQELLTEARVVK